MQKTWVRDTSDWCLILDELSEDKDRVYLLSSQLFMSQALEHNVCLIYTDWIDTACLPKETHFKITYFPGPHVSFLYRNLS